MRWAGFPEADADNLERHLAVHVGGSFNTTRAAWPHMVEQGYGRIVMTTSAGDVRTAEQPLVRRGQGRRPRTRRAVSRPEVPRTASRSISSRRRPSPAWPAVARTIRTWRRSWSRRWPRSSRTKTVRSPVGATRPVRTLRAHLHRHDRGLREFRTDDRSGRRALGDDQRRIHLLDPGRSHGVVGRVHSPPVVTVATARRSRRRPRVPSPVVQRDASLARYEYAPTRSSASPNPSGCFAAIVSIASAGGRRGSRNGTNPGTRS